MPDQVEFRAVADTNQAVQEFYKLVAAQREGEKATRDQVRASKEGERAARDHARSFDKVAGGARAVLGVLGVAGGIAGTISIIRREFEQWEAGIERINQGIREMAVAVTPFALMQAPEEMRPRIKEVGQLAVRYSQMPGLAWNAVQAYQAGSAQPTEEARYREGLAMYVAQQKLQLAGATEGGAREAIGLSRALNLTPAQMGRLTYAAGETSRYTVAQMAEAASRGLPMFKGIRGGAELGFSVMSMLTQQGMPAEDVGTFTQRFGIALLDKSWGKIGIRDATKDPMGALQKLHDLGITSMADLSRFGFGNIRELRGLSDVLTRWDDFIALRKEIQRIAATEGILEEKRATAEEKVPEIKRARELEKAVAKASYERIFSPQAQAAHQRELLGRARGIYFTRKGEEGLVPSTDIVTPFSWWRRSRLEMGWEPESGALAGPTQAQAMDVAVQEIMRELMEATIENTKATLENTAKTRAAETPRPPRNVSGDE